MAPPVSSATAPARDKWAEREVRVLRSEIVVGSKPRGKKKTRKRKWIRTKVCVAMELSTPEKIVMDI